MRKIKNLQLSGANALPVLVDVFFNDEMLQQPVIVYAHGFNGFKDWGNFDLIAEKFAAAGYVFIKFNFSHNGTTPEHPEEFENMEAFGQNNFTKELLDLQIVCDWTSATDNPYQQFINNNNISLIGHSMGGAVSILFAAKDSRIRKLITWAAVSECKTPWGNWPEAELLAWKKNGVAYYLNGRTKQQMPLYYQLFEDYQQNAERYDVKKAMSGLSIPVLICHGTADPAVPVQTAYQLAEWQDNAQLFTLETDHVFGRKHPWTASFLPAETLLVIEKSLLFLS